MERYGAMRTPKRRPPTFTAKMVCIALDVPRGTLGSWAYHGHFKDLDAAKTRPGKARKFTVDDLIRLAILKLLLDFGISGESARSWSTLCVNYMNQAKVTEMNVLVYRNGEMQVHLVGHLEMDPPPPGELMRLTLYPVEIMNTLKERLAVNDDSAAEEDPQ
jgi:hypothetical protein